MRRSDIPAKVLINEYERIEYYQDKILVFDKEDLSLIGEY